MIPKVKAIKTFNIQSILYDFPVEFMTSFINDLYSIMCSCTVSCNKRFVVGTDQNTSKHQNALGSRFELPIPHN